MIKLDNTIISLDIFEKYFMCDLNSCKGACCIEGDAGAPLENKEEKILNEIYEKIEPYMRSKGIEEIKKRGVAVYDSDGDLTTPLINSRECAFVVFEDGIAKCSIEKAYLDGKIDFKKPMSCHLFPIRINKYKDFEAINYERINICKSACASGNLSKIPLYTFVKEALIRKYGEDWYIKLVKSAKILSEE